MGERDGICGVIQTPELTITPLCLSGLNEQFACQLSLLSFIYG